MSFIVYLTTEEALEIHRQLIDEFGGAHGIRDGGLLESALYRLQSGYYESIFEQAASLLQSLALNHVFVHGNKRISFVCATTFLMANGFHFKTSADGAENFIIARVIEAKAAPPTIIARAVSGKLLNTVATVDPKANGEAITPLIPILRVMRLSVLPSLDCKSSTSRSSERVNPSALILRSALSSRSSDIFSISLSKVRSFVAFWRAFK